MVEPISKANDSDITRYNEFFSKQTKEKKSAELVQLVKQISLAIKTELTAEDAKRKSNNAEETEKDSNNRVNLTEMAEKLSEITEMPEIYFQFEIEKGSKNQLIMKVIDKITNEVIKQFPSDISLKIAKMLEENLGKGQIANLTV